MDDFFWVLNNFNVDNVYKKLFFVCLYYVYFKNGLSGVEISVGEMLYYE